MRAVLKSARLSLKKANLVAGMVRGKSVPEALEILRLMPKKGADLLYKVIHSAAHNAKANFGQMPESLAITEILVTKGPTLKRSLPISRGRAHPILKRTAHITVKVGAPHSGHLGTTSRKEVSAPSKNQSRGQKKTSPVPAGAKKGASKKTPNKTSKTRS